MRISSDTKLDFDDVLIVPQRSRAASRKEVQIERTFQFYHSPRAWSGVPIMAANMDTTGSFAMAKSLSKQKLITCLRKQYSPKELDLFYRDQTDTTWRPDKIINSNVKPYQWISIGLHDDLKRLSEFVSLQRATITGFEPNICIDIANGYTDQFVEYCNKVRTFFPESIIMAGNVCTPEMVQELILHGGVDIVKVGIGPGSVCTTRLVTGVGYPQLSAISECAHAAHGLKSGNKRMGLICADGGCKQPADISKAFCANADFVMLGGMLSGTDECDGVWEYDNNNNKIALKFYGMSSHEAQKVYSNKIAKYRASEGRVVRVEYKGGVDTALQEILGGIRSCCTYIGADQIKDMAKCAEFIRVNNTHNRTFEK